MLVLQPRGSFLPSPSLSCVVSALPLFLFESRSASAIARPVRPPVNHPALQNSLSSTCARTSQFSSEPPRRCRNPPDPRSSRSLFADELSACDTSKQVLEILRSPSFSSSTSASSAGVMLLPQDCLAFLNALLRVQLLRRSGPEFLHFCDLLEASLRAYNAKVEKEEGRRNMHAQGHRRKKGSRVGLAERDETERSRADHGRFIRAVLQKLADLKAPLAFRRMVRSLVLFPSASTESRTQRVWEGPPRVRASSPMLRDASLHRWVSGSHFFRIVPCRVPTACCEPSYIQTSGDLGERFLFLVLFHWLLSLT